MTGGLVDGGQHGRIGLLAVAQQNKLVAAQRIAPRQRTPHTGHRLFRRSGLPRRDEGCGRRQTSIQKRIGLLLGFRRAGQQLGGVTVHPADPHEQVGHRADIGHQHNKGHPGQRSLGIALVEQRVAGSAERQGVSRESQKGDKKSGHATRRHPFGIA